MPTQQLLLRLPDDLVRRFKQIVPARERSSYVRQLLEQSLPSVDSVRRTVVDVIPLSTAPGPRPPIVVAAPSARPGSVAVCDQIRAVDRSRLTRPGGALSGEDLRAIEAGLRAVLPL